MSSKLRFPHDPVYALVFACLSPCELVRVALTCRAAHSVVIKFKARAFDINRHFSRYFADPIAFRSLQAKTNTLVSGPNALQFLDRTCYPESDFDLYTHPGHSFEVAQFLVETEGYHYVPGQSQLQDWRAAIKRDWDGTKSRVGKQFRYGDHARPETGIRASWTFQKTGIRQECLTIQIIEALSSPLETILGFNSTCLMNFISSDTAYSLYPIATFENRSALLMQSSQSTTHAAQMHIQRDWKSVPTGNDREFFLGKARWVADKHSWKLSLDKTGVKERSPIDFASVPLTCDPVLFNGWTMKLSDGYKCHYYPLRTTLFRYNYAIPEEPLAFTIREWAYNQGKYSHDLISKEDWVWFDADIPGFLEANSFH